MIGRGVLGNPWIFCPGNTEFTEEGSTLFPSLEERQRVIEHHFLLLQNHYGEKGAMKRIRKHIAWYTKGLPSSASFRLKLFGLKEKDALFEAIKFYFDFIEKKDSCRSFTSTENRSATG
jgi:tRNA-dihydrouridine synthase B